MKNKAVITNALLLLFMALENLCLYYFNKQGILTQGKNAILLFLSSILFGIILLYRFYNTTISIQAPAQQRGKKISYALVTLLVLGLILMGIPYNTFLIEHPNPLLSSDIIPVIQIMCKRLFAGKYPYAIISAFGYDEHVAYFPFHWLPFTLAELLHIDYRWIPYLIWSIAALWLCVRSMKIPGTALKVAMPFIILSSNYVLFCNNNSVIEATVELMIAGYYMMLMTAMNKRNGVLQGVFISFCLLSRFSLVLWLPLYAYTLFITHNRKQLYLSVATATAIVLFIFVIPFLSQDWSLLTAFKGYDSAALFEWTRLNKDGKPLQLWKGTGFAYYFYTRFTGLDVAARIKLLQHTHIISCLLMTLIIGCWFWFKRKNIDYRIFLMGSFKIYLAIFLFLIQVPYEYLMCVGNFVTIAIFCEQARYVRTVEYLNH